MLEQRQRWEGEQLTLAPTNRYRRNLAALAALQPAVAAEIDAVRVPGGATLTTGRDGNPTFLIQRGSARGTWLGGSSMPTVSAPEVLSGFCGTGGNVALPGVLTGVEPLVVARRLLPHAALFVLEPDRLLIKLVLHVYDYTDLLAAGRMVFFTGGPGRFDESVIAFFEGHPGYELPQTLLPVPQRSAAQIAEIQESLESAGGKVAAAQSRIAGSIATRIRERSPSALSATPCVAVLSIDPRPASLEQARRIDRALEELGWPHSVCVPDTPEKCHLVARLQTIDEAQADLVLSVNCSTGSLSAMLPEDLPIASWYHADAAVQPPAPAETGPHRTFFVASSALGDGLVEAGVPMDAVVACAPCADVTAFHPVAVSDESGHTAHVEVAALMDLPDDRPEACGVDLASHLALWTALQSAARAAADPRRPDMAQVLLDRAQRKSGTSLEDPKVRGQFLACLRTRIAPAAMGRAVAEALVASGLEAGIWGRNWATDARYEKLCRGPIPVGTPLNRIMNSAAVLLFPTPAPGYIQTMLDGLAAGVRVVCGEPDEPLERVYPRLADVLPHLHFYRSTRGLVGLLRRLTTHEHDPESHGGAAGELVRTRHSTGRRLESIVEMMRRHPSPRKTASSRL